MRSETHNPTPQPEWASGTWEPSGGKPHAPIAHDELLARLRVLEDGKAQLEERQFIDAQLALLAERMRLNGEQPLGEWADALLVDVVAAAECFQAILFLRTEDGTALERIGGYACPEEAPQRVPLGLGITGQAAKSGQLVLLTDPQAFRSLTQTGLAKIEAQALLVMPLVYNDTVEGVLEIARTSPFASRHLDLLKALAPSLAASLNTVRNQQRIRRLLAEAQTRSEALLVQEEELRQNLEELQATQEQMRLAQAAAEEQRNQIRAIIDSTPDSILAFDAQQRLTIWNTAFAAEQEAQGRSLHPGLVAQELFVPTEAEQFDQAWQSVRQGHTFRAELQRPQPQGQPTHYAEVSLSPIWSRGEVAGAVAFIRDVTPQRHAQQELQARNHEMEAQEEELRQNLEELKATQEQIQKAQAESESQRNYIRALLDNNQDSIMAYDSQLRLMLFNTAAVRRFREVNNIQLQVGHTVDDLLPPDKRAFFLPLLQRVLGGEVVQFESRMELPNADTGELEERFFDIIYTPIRSADGTATGCLSVSRDVTRRKQAELALQHKAHETPAVLEGIQSGLLLTERETGTIRLVNSRLAHLLGLESADLMGRQTPDFYAQPAQRAELLAELQAHGQVNARPLQLRRPDGSLVWARVSVRGLEVEGTPCLIATFEDIGSAEPAPPGSTFDYAHSLLSSLMDNANEMITALDTQLRVTHYNAACQRYLAKFNRVIQVGESLDDVLGNAWAEIKPLYLRALSGETFQITGNFSTQDGQPIIVESTFSPIRNGSGEIIGCLCVSQDVLSPPSPAPDEA